MTAFFNFSFTLPLLLEELQQKAVYIQSYKNKIIEVTLLQNGVPPMV
jgi:hypothetical protein